MITLTNELVPEKVTPSYTSRPRNKRVTLPEVLKDKDIIIVSVTINGKKTDLMKYVVNGDAEINKEIKAVVKVDYVEQRIVEEIDEDI